jgi:hypothetical protein
MKTLDIETAEGLAEFQQWAKRNAAVKAASGMGAKSTRLLLRSLHSHLVFHDAFADAAALAPFIERFDRLSTRLTLTPNERADAAHLVERDALADAEVTALLRRLTTVAHNHYAEELTNRINGRPGPYSREATRTLLREWADEARARGDVVQARALRSLALLPGAGDALAPERAAVAPECGASGKRHKKPKAEHKKVLVSQDKLRRYFAFMEANKDFPTREAQDRFAAGERLTRDQFNDWLRRALDRWNKLTRIT